MAENKINVGGRLHSIATGNILAGADEIIDENKNKIQSVINTETDAALANRYTKDETYNKTQLDSMITTPDIDYKNYDTYADMLSETNHPAGAIYRVANYDGTQAVTNKYAEYSWDGTQYKLMAVRNYGIDNKPTAGSDNLVTSGGVYSSTPTVETSTTESNLDISDEQGKVLARFAGGHLQVKNFSSADVLESIKAILSNIGFNNIPEFNEEVDYAVGDIVRYGKYVYIFTSAHTAGEWDGTETERTIINTEHPVEVDNSRVYADFDISDENKNVLVRFEGGHAKTKNFDSRNYSIDQFPVFSASEQYTVGEKVQHDGKLYRFTSAHIGIWNESDVEPITIFDIVEDAVEVVTDDSTSELNVADEQGNVLASFKNGGFKIRDFNSSQYKYNLPLVEGPHIVPNGQVYAEDGLHNFCSWVFCTPFADIAHNIIGFFYSSKPYHTADNYGVLMFKKRVAGVWSSPILVSPEPASGVIWYSCCSMVMENGDYVTIAKDYQRTGYFYKFKSSDLGETWTKELLVDSNNNGISGDGATCLIKTTSGRYMFYSWNEYQIHSSSLGQKTSRVYFSDDNMATWNYTELQPVSENPTEASLMQLSNGNIILIRRRGDVNYKANPFLFLSEDNGNTWSLVGNMKNIECDTNPVNILRLDNENILLFYATRWPDSDGRYRVSFTATNEKDLENNKVGFGTVLFRHSQRDLGYCGSCIDEFGFINLFWYAQYNGINGNAKIFTAKFKIIEKGFTID